MALENTGIISGSRHSALLISPQSAFVIEASCKFGCAPIFYVAGSTWVDDVDDATIFRSMEAGEIAKGQARMAASDCLADGVFDVKPLAGYVK